MMATKQRLDLALVERGLASTRTQAQALIMAGRVRAGTTVLTKAGQPVAHDQALEITQPETMFASRGGTKLDSALESFEMDVRGLVAIDVGASTGGFTDVLLRRGVQRVYAVDVGYGQLAWELRQDPRVVVLERTNIRYLTAEALGGVAPSLAVIDVSFISLEKVLPPVHRLLGPDGRAVALIKPQFEAGRGHVGKGGVVRSPDVHRRVLATVLDAARRGGWWPCRLMASPLRGPAGNREFLAVLSKNEVMPALDVTDAIERALTAGAPATPLATTADAVATPTEMC
ncbi:MAG: TlyA family rRNA (cytidine-2'-O)-methyltransferase [Chloroflexota bacterium]